MIYASLEWRNYSGKTSRFICFNTPVFGSVLVRVNGIRLRDNEFTIKDKTLTILLPIQQKDYVEWEYIYEK